MGAAAGTDVVVGLPIGGFYFGLILPGLFGNRIPSILFLRNHFRSHIIIGFTGLFELERVVHAFHVVVRDADVALGGLQGAVPERAVDDHQAVFRFPVVFVDFLSERFAQRM